MNGNSTERRWDSFEDDIKKAMQMVKEAADLDEELVATELWRDLNIQKTLLMERQLSASPAVCWWPSSVGKAAPPAAPAAAGAAADFAEQLRTAAGKVPSLGGILSSCRTWSALGQVLAAGTKGVPCSHPSTERQLLLAQHVNKQHKE